VIAEDEIAAIKRHLRVFWRAESLIIEMRLHAVMRRTGFFAFAGLIAVFGLAMLNVAAYFALAPIWGDAPAMLVVAVADFIIAGILIAIGSRETSGIELTLAQEITMLLILMLTSKGMAGVPRASLVVIAATLTQFNIPEAGLLLILGIDHFLDMGRTATNAVGNAIATAAVAKWEDAIDPVDGNLAEADEVLPPPEEIAAAQAG